MPRPAVHKAEDWVAAGWRALAEGGPAAVRIEALARSLGVTKGGFYGHFADRAALLDAMLAGWRERAGSGLIARVEARGGDPRDKLWALIETVIREGARSPEPALRTWARGSEAVRAALAAVDRRRLDYLDAQFQAMGFGGLDATSRARLCYLALIAEHQLATAPSLAERLAAARAQFALLTAGLASPG
ncbi:MAG: TetR/AcrR family transcriptional regulator [Pseudomonadota bacterium]